MAQKTFCDFCSGEMNNANDGSILIERTVYRNKAVNVSVEIRSENQEKFYGDICNYCTFAIIDQIDPRPKAEAAVAK